MTGARPAVSFRILGPVEVVVDGRLLPLQPRLQKTLAMLLSAVGRVVPTERLVAALWDSGPPASARDQVHICVSTLRRALCRAECGSDLIVTRPPGYALDLGSHQLDSVAFSRALTAARAHASAGSPQAAALCLSDALGQWRGQALAGLRGSLLEAIAARLEQERLGAWDELVELALALGRHRTLLPELVQLAAENPLRERTVAALALALYRDGMRAEALAHLHGFRVALAEELGLDPSPEFAALHAAALRGTAADWPWRPA